MAMAVKAIYQGASYHRTENGFYYDFDNPEPFTEKDLKAIQKEMVKIINRKLPVVREEVSRERRTPHQGN